MLLEPDEGREEGRETNIDARGKHQLVASHTHMDWGLYVASVGIEPAT